MAEAAIPPSRTLRLDDDDAKRAPHYVVDAPKLPPLTDMPTAYAGCCLALSAPLVARLRSLLSPSPALTLSIGSGFGLLEAHLLASPRICIVGVEVAPSPNKYLPALHHRTVQGSRFLEPLAREATTWLFVYPRRAALVSEYINDHGGGSVESIIWIGPRADWNEYMTCFTGWHLQTQSANEFGGRPWDLIAVAEQTK
jgi:hypothetical protein